MREIHAFQVKGVERGPAVLSRGRPSLLLAPGSRRFSRFVVAGAGPIAGLLMAKGSGTDPAGVRGGSGIGLCLQGLPAGFRIQRCLGLGVE